MTALYLIGPDGGQPYAAKLLTADGYTVVNDLTTADGIAAMPGWEYDAQALAVSRASTKRGVVTQPWLQWLAMAAKP